MKIPYAFKKCKVCGRWLVANTVNFHRNKGGKYGLGSQCKDCRKQYRKQWYENNKDKTTKYNKQYCQNNKEKIAKLKKRYYEANKDKRLEYHKQYREANKTKIAEHKKQYNQSPQGQVLAFNRRQRRRTKEEQQGTGITKDQWLEMMKFFNWECAYSGEGLTKDTRSIDHIVPLNSDGDNMIWNMVPMLRNLNISKHDKDMLEWYKEQNFYDTNRLDKIYQWQEYARKNGIRRKNNMGYIWKGTQAMDMERYEAIKNEIKAFEQERITNNIMDYYRYHELYRLLYKLQAKLRKEGLL